MCLICLLLEGGLYTEPIMNTHWVLGGVTVFAQRLSKKADLCKQSGPCSSRLLQDRISN